MTSIYSLVEKIKDFLYAHPLVNHVTFGDIMSVDLDKTTIYPLSHFTVTNSTIGKNYISFDLSFLFLDVVDYKKEYDDDKSFRDDASNILDVFNTQLQIANALISDLRRGDLYNDKFQMEDDPVCQMFKDKYENELVGWKVDLTITMPNDISIC
jgi:hypothetical protein